MLIIFFYFKIHGLMNVEMSRSKTCYLVALGRVSVDHNNTTEAEGYYGPLHVAKVTPC